MKKTKSHLNLSKTNILYNYIIQYQISLNISLSKYNDDDDTV